MKLEKLKNLLIRLCIDGDLSICGTCINDNNGCCKYGDNDECNSNLAHYEPDEDKF